MAVASGWNKLGIAHRRHLDGRFGTTDGTLSAPEALSVIHLNTIFIAERNRIEPATFLTGPAFVAGSRIHCRTIAARIAQLRAIRAQ